MARKRVPRFAWTAWWRRMLLLRLIDLYSLIVLASVVLSWIPSAQGHPVARFIEAATEPVLRRIRTVLPPMGGLDLSPLVLLLALQLIKRLLF
jgi:YggT family protein